MKTVTITLRNLIGVPVDASIITTSDPARFTTGTAPGIIPAGESRTLDVNFLADTVPGVHQGFLSIPATGLIIPLTAETLAAPEIILDGSLGSAGLEVRLVKDDVAEWFECGFLSPSNDLLGSAADGWTDAEGYLLFRMERSDDLINWDHDWTDAPGSPEGPDANGDYKYWARSDYPSVWKYVTIDLTLTTDRAAKSITDLVLFGATISLPNYPYAMPADAAQLQTDLRAAGYTGATVSSVAAPLSVVVTNHLETDNVNFPVTLSGSDVTDVKNASGTTISLPDYPYAMPGQITDLQADLIAAGYPYISARAYDDAWTIFIPDRSTTFSTRDITATITPADPYTYLGIGGTGTDAGNLIRGTFGNLRATTGLDPLEEAPKQFARVGVSRGPNYQYDP